MINNISHNNNNDNNRKKNKKKTTTLIIKYIFLSILISLVYILLKINLQLIQRLDVQQQQQQQEEQQGVQNGVNDDEAGSAINAVGIGGGGKKNQRNSAVTVVDNAADAQPEKGEENEVELQKRLVTLRNEVKLMQQKVDMAKTRVDRIKSGSTGGNGAVAVGGVSSRYVIFSVFFSAGIVFSLVEKKGHFSLYPAHFLSSNSPHLNNYYRLQQ